MIAFSHIVFADSDDKINYSGVLEDLQKDETFDTSEYPKVNTDYSLQVIQIGESENNELFVYVYQPCGNSKDLRACSVRISTAINDNAKWQDYPLTYIDNEDTLYKYRVDSFTVNSDLVRYYDIPCIFRPWDERLNDEKPSNSNTVTEVSYSVNQLWTVSTSGDEIAYRMEKPDYIEVTDKYVGTLNYFEDKGSSDIDTWVFYIAFSTDILMEKLYEADISFAVEFIYATTGKVSRGQEQSVTISSDQKGSAMTGGWYWWSKRHTWKAIESASDFVKTEKLTNEVNTYVKNKQWIVRFHTITNKHDSSDKGVAGSYRAADTTILRLNFITDGLAYNLGVVDNKQSGSGEKDNIEQDPLDWFKAILQWIKGNWEWLVPVIVGSIIAIVLLIVFAPFLPIILSGIVSVLKAFGHCLLWLLKGIWWLISAPFRLIAHLISGSK